MGLVVNPTAGSGRGAAVGAQAADALTALGHQVIDLSGVNADQASAYARSAVSSAAIDVLAVVGGDGTVNLGCQACAGSDVPLAIVGAGSGNDFSRSLGMSAHSPEAAARHIHHGALREVDLGRSDNGRWFAGVLAAGLDAKVNARANSWATVPVLGGTGKLRYTLALGREALSLTPIPFRLELDGVVHEREALIVAVGNGSTYGGGMRICAPASLEDGQFTITLVRPVSLWTLVRVFPRVFDGSHIDHPAVEIFTAREVRISADSFEHLHVLADGDEYAPLPVTVRTIPGALKVVVPASA